MLLADARKAVEAIRGQTARGIDVVAERKALRKPAERPATLGDAWSAFIGSGRHRDSTARDYEALWRTHLSSFAGRPIAEITVSEVQRVMTETARRVAKRGQDGRDGKRTANKVLALVRVLISSAGLRGEANPLSKGRVEPYHEAPRTRRLTEDETTRLRAALDGFELRWQDYFRLALLTGARKAALLAMRWQDLDLERRVWSIPAIWSKNRATMLVPLVTEAVELIRNMQQRRGPSAFVFPGDRDEDHLKEPKRAWARLCAAANIEKLRQHDLRRTLGSRLGETGAGAFLIASALGHKSVASARAYVHPELDAVRDAMERAGGRR